MKLTRPKKQSNPVAQLSYVTSEAHPDSEPDRHIVVRIMSRPGVYYCDCRDFFVRRLPLLGTAQFSLCKHGDFVRDADNSIPYTDIVEAVRDTKKKFGVFFATAHNEYRSLDLPGTYPTQEAAQFALDKYEALTHRFGARYVRAL